MRVASIAPLAVLLIGCGGDPNGLSGADTDAPGGSSSTDGGTTHGGDSGSSGPGSTSGGGTFGDTAVARAESWIAAKVPYCGGPNGGSDVICGGTCVRSGDAANPEWDPYRSDCSGFVSYAWALKAPGHVTTGFAPYDTSVSASIDASELAPGDALNNQEHVMLFARWTDPAKHIAHIMEESDCGRVALEKDVGLQLDGGDSVTILDTTGRVFHAIRYGGN